MSNTSCSIVEIFGGQAEGHRCGYCKSPSNSLSYGMWAHSMTIQDYQDLIDRGWRRSGKYCYKPIMDKTCCPSYTIRCNTCEFKLSKSQKKVLRRMHHYLVHGGNSKECGERELPGDDCADAGGEPCEQMDASVVQEKARLVQLNLLENPMLSSRSLSTTNNCSPSDSTVSASGTSKSVDAIPQTVGGEVQLEVTERMESSAQRQPIKGSGADPSKPPCRKAKLVRQEKKLQIMANKLKTQGITSNQVTANVKHQHKQKPLHEYLNEPIPAEAAHKLEIKLVRSQPASQAFQQTFNETYDLYKLYQTTIHMDPPTSCPTAQFNRFLVHSPLESEESSDPAHPGYGSFHQQYWLDGKLIAVGVLDILPLCVSSVYFYYDPAYKFLSLGTYGALREIAFAQDLSRFNSNLKYYYMGFYIHSCVKMRYKGRFDPSHLLCPEVYSWHPLKQVQHKLDASKYSRLNADNAQDENGKVTSKDIMILQRQRPISYEEYLIRSGKNKKDHDEVMEYARYVGIKCAPRMLLFRK